MEIAPNAERFAPLDPELRERWMGFAKWDTQFYPMFVGLEMEDVRQDYCRMRLRWRDPELLQPQGVMHGGAIATMVDSVVVPAIAAGFTERRRMGTINLAVNYVAPVIQSDIIGEGWVTRRGKSVVYCQAEVWNEAAEQVAFGTVVYNVGRATAEFTDVG